MKNLTAVIPVRQGSQRVINKNFKPFHGKSLLEHKIEMIKRLPVDNIIVNTDSDTAIEYAKKNNIDYHRREAYYASSECTNSEYHEYLAKVTNSKYILIAQVTAPLIRYETFLEAIDLFNTTNCDSLMSVKEVKEFLWYNDKPLNYSLSDAPNSQNLPEIFKLNFAVNILSTKQMYLRKSLIGKKPFLFKLDEIEGFDINSEFEFSFAEFLFKKING